MPAESAKATISSFTGVGWVRVVDDSAGTPLSRNMTPANLAADTAFADKFVQVVGDTMTGNLTVSSGNLSVESTSFPTITIKDTDQGNNQAYKSYVGAGGYTIGSVNDTSGTIVAFIVASDASVDMRTAPRVRVPAVTGNQDAAQVTAYDAALGRLQVGGHEVGDTGWRNVSSLLLNSWTATTIHLRRTGDVCNLVIENLVPGSANTVLDTPTGFEPHVAQGFLITRSSSTAVQLSPTLSYGRLAAAAITLSNSGTAYYGTVTWTTTQTWPTSLPGTAA